MIQAASGNQPPVSGVHEGADRLGLGIGSRSPGRPEREIDGFGSFWGPSTTVTTDATVLDGIFSAVGGEGSANVGFVAFTGPCFTTDPLT